MTEPATTSSPPKSSRGKASPSPEELERNRQWVRDEYVFKVFTARVPRPLVVVDFDSTVCDSMTALYEHQDIWNDSDVKIGREHQVWGFDEVLDFETRAMMWSWYNSDEGIAAAKPLDGAIETLADLIRQGVYIYVCSDRPADCQFAVERWFLDHGLPADDFYRMYVDCLGGISKKDREVRWLMQKSGYEVIAIIEDAPHHMEAYDALHGDFRVYSFRYPYNAALLDKGLAQEVTSWAAFGKIIQDELD